MTGDSGHSSSTPDPIISTGTSLRGYAALSAYQSLIPEVVVFRRFGALHYRNLQYLQDELLEIEEQLRERDMQPGEHGCRRLDQDPVRIGLLVQLRKTLRQYDEALLSTAAVQKLQRADKKGIQATAHFLRAARPLVSNESAFIDVKHDLAFLNGPSEEPVPSVVSRPFMAIGAARRLVRSKERADLFKSLNVEMKGFSIYLPDPTRVKWFMRSLVTFTGCTLLLIPILLLYFFQDKQDGVKLSIIISTVLGFTVISSGITAAKNWEIVAASIAYAAVLVVFISSGVGGTGPAKPV